MAKVARKSLQIAKVAKKLRLVAEKIPWPRDTGVDMCRPGYEVKHLPSLGHMRKRDEKIAIISLGFRSF